MIKPTIYMRDVLALIWIIVFVFLKMMGINHTVDYITIGILGFYFSKRLYEEQYRQLAKEIKKSSVPRDFDIRDRFAKRLY